MCHSDRVERASSSPSRAKNALTPALDDGLGDFYSVLRGEHLEREALPQEGVLDGPHFTHAPRPTRLTAW